MGVTEIILVYDGDAVRQGRMNVYDLAPALLGVGDAFRNANALLNANQVNVTVDVHERITRGSFEITLVIDHALIEQVKTLFSADVKTAKDLAILLGFSLGMGERHAAQGVLHLMKLLKDYLITEVSPPSEKGTVILKIENSTIKDSFIEVNNDSYKLYKNQTIRENMERITRPLDHPGIDKIEVREEDRTVETINREERKYFKPPPPQEQAAATLPIPVPTERIEELEVVSPVFKKDNKWRLTDGNATYNVEIADEAFLQRVARHEETFGQGDVLKVRLSKSTRHTPSGLKTDYIVEQVLDVIRPPKLPF